MKCASKMHIACLKLCDVSIPSKLNEKRKAVSDHWQSMNSKFKNVKEIKVELIVRTSHKLVAQLMVSNEKNIEIIKTHCK